MRLYTAFDLHSNNSYLGIVDENGKRVFKRKLANDPVLIMEILKPFKDDIAGIAVESTYNWYWLVDLLMAEGYKVHLANPAEIQKYTGLKYVDDQHDAFWLTEMLRLGILPEGYIYPKEDRPVRDLLRKRGHLVRLRTSLIISLQNIISRNNGIKLKVGDIKILSTDRVTPLLERNEDLALAGKVSKESIDFLTRKIKAVEAVVEKRMELREPYDRLLTEPGIGKILGLTVMLETGPISRFAKVGNYVSYCRKVSSKWISNEKKKGKGNKKSGNKYLAWAFSEAAEIARRYDEDARAYFNRKAQQTNRMVAHNALAHKLDRAAFYIMRDGVSFMPEKCFV
ncbi:MAG TPA: IS110 family transposase [Nitrospirota bacterium]|nr:IS110 family transposase [Nitrospirota bacterium]